MDNSIVMPKSEVEEKTIKTWHMFLIITVLSIIISFAFQKLIMTQEVYYNIYGSQMEEYRIDDYISMVQKFQILGYLATPLFVWLRIAFVAFLLQLPFLIKFIEIPFKEIFRIVTIAYFVLFTADIIRFFYLYFQPPEQITMDSLTFLPLGITNLLDNTNYSEAAFTFLNKINLFELIWCIVVFIGLNKTGKLEKIDNALIVFGVWVSIAILVSALTLFIGSIS